MSPTLIFSAHGAVRGAFIALAALGLGFGGCGDEPGGSAVDVADTPSGPEPDAAPELDTASSPEPDTAGPGGDTGPSDTTPADTAVAEPEPWMPASCWPVANAMCDARSGTGCDLDAGETCDVGFDSSDRLVVGCFPGPNDVGAGGACNPQSGPFCGPGLSCASDGVCRRFCCDATACAAAEVCAPFGSAGSLGTCGAETPTCGGPGAHCARASDCCSNHCHGDHCH